eukprot:11048893-Alexandrium_andersonii.AAC.1
MRQRVTPLSPRLREPPQALRDRSPLYPRHTPVDSTVAAAQAAPFNPDLSGVEVHVDATASDDSGGVVREVKEAVSYTHLTLPTICSV